MKSRFHSAPRNAFTLIELVVVIAIIALLTTLAVMSSSSMMDRYQLSRAVEAVEMFDARARREASSLSQPVDATIQPARRRLLVASPTRTSQRRPLAQFNLPRSVEIAELRLRRRVAARGDLELQFNRAGVSPTYALQLKRGEMSRWLVVLGFSGQIVALEDEREVDELLSL